ncbi:MAG: transcriptional regulator [Anaerolinea sp.]|nr:transcriptional regulator [Anaerolinea sp.]
MPRASCLMPHASCLRYTLPMAIYEYYCPTCRDKFEKRKPMSQAGVATTCTKGHRAERTITAFAMARTGAGEEFSMPAGGGCCGGGGGCACSN